jgi:hypothetical protein
MVFFVSGHLDLTREEFLTHYAQRLRAAVSEGAEFVIGDADGADSMAQEFLTHLSATVTVYHMFHLPRNNYGFETIGGFQSDKERDEAMTKNSDDDIAWVRPGRNKSGTAKNLIRRRLRRC